MQYPFAVPAGTPDDQLPGEWIDAEQLGAHHVRTDRQLHFCPEPIVGRASDWAWSVQLQRALEATTAVWFASYLIDSPWWLKWLAEFAREGKDVRVVVERTTLRTETLPGFEAIVAAGGQVRVHAQMHGTLHAKLYGTDGAAWVGSANLTRTARSTQDIMVRLNAQDRVTALWWFRGLFAAAGPLPDAATLEHEEQGRAEVALARIARTRVGMAYLKRLGLYRDQPGEAREDRTAARLHPEPATEPET